MSDDDEDKDPNDDQDDDDKYDHNKEDKSDKDVFFFDIFLRFIGRRRRMALKGNEDHPI